jgi:hypothetical protein
VRRYSTSISRLPQRRYPSRCCSRGCRRGGAPAEAGGGCSSAAPRPGAGESRGDAVRRRVPASRAAVCPGFGRNPAFLRSCSRRLWRIDSRELIRDALGLFDVLHLAGLLREYDVNHSRLRRGARVAGRAAPANDTTAGSVE